MNEISDYCAFFSKARGLVAPQNIKLTLQISPSLQQNINLVISFYCNKGNFVHYDDVSSFSQRLNIFYLKINL